jgi:tRNA(Ile)-lysidine synthase
MFNTFRSLPKQLYVAFSGGADSTFCLHYLLEKGHKVTAVHYQHDADNSKEEFEHVIKHCKEYNVPYLVNVQFTSENGSKEEAWRIARYNFFHSLDTTVVIGANLDDAVEWYLLTTLLRGEGQYYEYANKNVVKPFFLHRKEKMLEYLNKNNISYFHDRTNDDENFCLRNKVRHNLVPAALMVQPGLYGLVRSKLISKNTSV